MAIEKKVETLEGELKLMKGELKETLTNVRDFLLNLKMPPPHIEGLEGGETSKVDIGGVLSTAVGSVAQVPVQVGRTVEMPQADPVVQPVESGQPMAAPAAAVPPSPQVLRTEAPPGTGAVMGEVSSLENQARDPGQFVGMGAPAQPVASELREGEEEPQGQIEEGALPDELPEQHRDEERSEPLAEQETAPAASSTSQVNLLGNLLRWVSVATEKIGTGQLPTFLDIYSVTGNLSPETREVILRFADVVAQQPAYASADNAWGHIMVEQLATFLEVHSINGEMSPDVKEGILRFASTMVAHPSEKNISDVWGRLSLELHGILSGGGKLPQALVIPQNIEEPEALADEAEVDEGEIEKTVGQEERTVTLKLVFPTSGGAEKEFNVDNFSINVNPEAGVGNSQGKASKVKKARRKKS